MKIRLGRVNKDRQGGGLILLLGLIVTHEGISYKVGTLSSMGPGFFPTALGVILVITGTLIALLGSSEPAQHETPQSGTDWRGWSCILLGIASFVVLGQYGGLVPATFMLVFISALGDRNNTPAGAFIVASTLVVVCVGVFWWALQLQMPLFQWGEQ